MEAKIEQEHLIRRREGIDEIGHKVLVSIYRGDFTALPLLTFSELKSLHRFLGDYIDNHEK